MKKLLFAIFLAAGMVITQPALADTSVTVGNDEGDDFRTIQDAIDASTDGYYISVDRGTYNENLIISSPKQLTISGNPFNSSSVVINGTITVHPGADAQLDYLTINAAGKNYGVKILGHATIQYGTIIQGEFGVLVESNGVATLYDQEIRGADRSCVKIKQSGRATIESSIIKNCGRAAILANGNKTFRVADSTLRNSVTGITVKNATNPNSELLRNTFKSNTVGLRLLSSSISRADNTFVGNGQNVIQ